MAARKRRPCEVEGCMCKLPGATLGVHGRPPKKCETCGGQTGLHRMGCPNMDTHVAFFDHDAGEE